MAARRDSGSGVWNGRVIIGDVAATLVDLALRGLLRIDEEAAADGGWQLTLAVASRSRSAQSALEYEQVLIAGVAGVGETGSLSDQGEELVVRIRVFQRDLRHLTSAEGPRRLLEGCSPMRSTSGSQTRPRICW